MRKEMLSSEDYAMMTGFHMLISELMQILHCRVIHHMPGQDDHEVIPVIRESLELRIEFHQVHAAER